VIGPQTLAAVITEADVQWFEFDDADRPKPLLQGPLRRIVPVGSVSKLVVSLAVLGLATRAELDLDRAAERVRALPGAPSPSVRDLLCHVSGIPPWHWLRTQRPQAWAAPGTVWSYSEVGPIVAAAEVAAALRITIRELIRENVADRCGLELLGRAVRERFEPGFERLGGIDVRMPPLGTDPESNGWLSHGMLARWSDLVALGRSLLRRGALHPEARLARTPYQSATARIPFQGVGARLVPQSGTVWGAHGGQWLGYGFFLAFGDDAAVVVGSSGRRRHVPHVRHLARSLLDELASKSAASAEQHAENRLRDGLARSTTLAAAGPRCLNLTARQRYGDSIRLELTGHGSGTLVTARHSYQLSPADGSGDLWAFRARGELCHVYMPSASRYAVIERPCAVFRQREESGA
jgi:CubicO group peptidase (beta-lactamase class C family)